jgi:hypothetical protein
MVFVISEPKRPFVCTDSLLTMHRPADWHKFGVETCHNEVDRRKAISTLMNDDEREFFNLYCCLRDE